MRGNRAGRRMHYTSEAKNHMSYNSEISRVVQGVDRRMRCEGRRHCLLSPEHATYDRLTSGP